MQAEFAHLQHYVNAELGTLPIVTGITEPLKQTVNYALNEISSLYEQGKIDPKVNLVLDLAKPSSHSIKPAHPARIGYFPFTSDPIHWEHLAAILKAIAALKLDCVVVQVNGDIPNYKPNKSPEIHRHAMTELALGPFWPLIRYTPLGYGDTRTGGELIYIFAQQNKLEHVFYVTGAEDMQWKLDNLRRGWKAHNESFGTPCFVTVVFSQRESRPKDFRPMSMGEVPHEIWFIDGPRTGITSSEIRRSTLPLLCPLPVRRYIERHGLY